MKTRDESYDKDKLRVLRPPLGGAAHLSLAQTGPIGDVSQVGSASGGHSGLWDAGERRE